MPTLTSPAVLKKKVLVNIYPDFLTFIFLEYILWYLYIETPPPLKNWFLDPFFEVCEFFCNWKACYAYPCAILSHFLHVLESMALYDYPLAPHATIFVSTNHSIGLYVSFNESTANYSNEHLPSFRLGTSTLYRRSAITPGENWECGNSTVQ